ncbi:MAG: glutamine-hydrolyzing carbamoyl-phosphate synthase small subunit [bacterium]|nr:glutamine-hydrolyzing carbamoyl-phosphate synthase small subunit [bacterium]
MREQKTKECKLVLEDGTVITGHSFGAETPAAGEVVFNTAMTGYPESLTDPSYKGQILVLTYPLVGNYGVPDDRMVKGISAFFESDRVHISGLVISDYSYRYSHWNAKKSLSQWLKENNVPAMYGVDTRALTKLIREKGSMPGKMIAGKGDIGFYDPNRHNLAAEVSTSERMVYGNGKYRVLLVDCGVKNNIIRCFLEYDTTVIRVPWDHDIKTEEYEGLFVSNGPGNPEMCEATIQHLTHALKGDTPIFGICLGNQLMALAAGATTYKLKYGHRSHNQPVLRVDTEKAYITSQNHGFAVDNDSLSDEWKPLFVNLNDGTNEGMQHKTKPFFSSQFHPEASGGPSDTKFLFEQFMGSVDKAMA